MHNPLSKHEGFMHITAASFSRPYPPCMDAFTQDSSAQVHPLSATAVPPKATSGLWRRVTSSRFLLISIAVHIVLGIVATVLIVQTVTLRRKPVFAAPPSANQSSTHSQEHKVQMAQKQKTMSAPAQMKRITSTALNSKVALPVMPAMPTMSHTVSPMMAGMGGVGTGLSMGGTGGGGGGSGGGGPTLFGLRKSGGSSLVGTFYDFKQTPDGKPTSMVIAAEGMLSAPERPANDENKKLIGSFANGGFNEGLFNIYFKGPVPLYATQVFIPMIPSELGPSEFNLADKVKGRRWAVVYRGQVSPPEGGRYHFVGAADDYLIVRFQHKIVLDGSLFHPSGKKEVKELFYDGMSGSMRCDEGDAFTVNDGEFYDIEILIGEQPGGETCAFLMLEKDGAEYAKDSKGNPLLPIFKTARGDGIHSGRAAPVVGPDTSWSVWKAQRQQ